MFIHISLTYLRPQAFYDRGIGQYASGIARLYNHLKSRQCSREIMRMWWSYYNRYTTDIETAVESSDEVYARRIDQSNMVSYIPLSFLKNKSCNTFSASVKL